MALPTTITNTTPAQTGTAPSNLGTQARQIKIDMQDLFGIPNATAISTAGTVFTADGLTRVFFSDSSGTVHNIQNTGVQFNEQGLNIDFRIEGNNTPNLFNLDAGRDAISFGGANVDGCAIAFNNLRQRTHITSVGSQTHMPAQTTDFDNASSTIAVGSATFFGIPTWTNASATLTMTEAATVVIGGAPVGSTNVTITTAHALWVQVGNTRLATLTLGTDLPVTEGGTGSSTGSITGTSGLVFAAGGSNEDVTLTPSGTGKSIVGGDTQYDGAVSTFVRAVTITASGTKTYDITLSSASIGFLIEASSTVINNNAAASFAVEKNTFRGWLAGDSLVSNSIVETWRLGSNFISWSLAAVGSGNAIRVTITNDFGTETDVVTMFTIMAMTVFGAGTIVTMTS